MQEVEAEIELSENTSVCPVEIWMPCAHAFSLSLSYTRLWHAALNFSLSRSLPTRLPAHLPPTPSLFLSLSFTHTVILSRHTCVLSLSLSLSRHSLIRCDTSTLLYIHLVYLLNKHSLPLLLSFTNRMSISFFYVTKAIFVKEYQLVINCAILKGSQPVGCDLKCITGQFRYDGRQPHDVKCKNLGPDQTHYINKI